MASLKELILRNRPFVSSLLLFLALFISYHMLHPRGFSTAVFIQNANESVAIAFVAMAQTIPVLIGGLDLSVGAVMTLANCVASHLVTGTPAQMILGMGVTLAVGTGFGLMNGLIVVFGRTDNFKFIDFNFPKPLILWALPILCKVCAMA